MAFRTWLSIGILLAQLFVISNGRTPAKLERIVLPTIVGGDPVDPPDKYPWMVALACLDEDQQNMFVWCGGSLIAPNFVLSAAHCHPESISECDLSTFFVIFR